MIDEQPKCVLCDGDLDITATLIGCKWCGTIWGRVNGTWVEVLPEPAQNVPLTPNNNQ